MSVFFGVMFDELRYKALLRIWRSLDLQDQMSWSTASRRFLTVRSDNRFYVVDPSLAQSSRALQAEEACSFALADTDFALCQRRLQTHALRRPFFTTGGADPRTLIRCVDLLG